MLLLIFGLRGFSHNDQHTHSEPPEEEHEHEHGEEHEHEHEHEHGEKHGHGEVKLTTKSFGLADLKIEPAVKKPFTRILQVNGFIEPNETKVSRIIPKHPGVVREIYVKLGDYVQIGQKLAQIEANGSEVRYFLTAKIPGYITQKEMVVGQFVSAQHPNLVITNLDEVWAHLIIPDHYISQVKIGQSMLIKDWENTLEYEGNIDLLAKTLYKDSQSLLVRVTMKNKEHRWHPGTFIKGYWKITHDHEMIVIPRSAIQTVEEKESVYIMEEPYHFKPVPVEIHSANEDQVQIAHGLEAGDQVVVQNSFILKAESGKSEAGHSH